jgi:hypothetical protein
MGVFSGNRTSLSNYDVVAAEGYMGQTGCLQALIEAQQNDMAVFEAVIKGDFEETYALQEGTVLEAEMVSLQEGVISGLFEKVKELLKKLLEKLKGIFDSFMKRFDSVVMTDNKAFVKKYELEVRKKDLKDMKYKYSKPTGKTPTTPNFEKAINIGINVTTAAGKDSTKDLQDYREKNVDDNQIAEKLYGQCVGSSTLTKEEFVKEFDELMFESEEEFSDGASEAVNIAMKVLAESKEAIKDAEKTNKELNDKVKKMLKDAEEEQKESDRRLKGDKDARDDIKKLNELLSKKASLIYDIVLQVQQFVLTYTEQSLKAVQKGIREYRKVFARAVVYKAVKEDIEDLYAVVDEAAEYDVDSAFGLC